MPPRSGTQIVMGAAGWAGGFFAFKLARGLQADAATAATQQVIIKV